MATNEGRPVERKGKPRTGRSWRTVRALLVMAAIGLLLGLYSAFTSYRDVALATGPQSEDQRRFFISSADRPDMAQFFKSLTHEQKVAMSRNLGRYTDSPIAKVIGTCLETFDVEARELLSVALAHVATVHPDAVVGQLDKSGGFQQRAVSRALAPQSPAVLPLVAEKLTNSDFRTNASRFLVDAGAPSVPFVLPLLDHADKDVRLIAADILGKLRAWAAVNRLTEKVLRPSNEKMSAPESALQIAAFRAALASIGDPASESLLSNVMQDPQIESTQRAQAALGLGRINTPTSRVALSEFAESDDLPLQRACIDALRLCGPEGIRVPLSNRVRIAVAQGVKGEEADSVLSSALEHGELAAMAAIASSDRPTLVGALVRSLSRYADRGDIVDAIVSALSRTEDGRRRLAAFRNDQKLSGFVRRALG